MFPKISLEWVTTIYEYFRFPFLLKKQLTIMSKNLVYNLSCGMFVQSVNNSQVLILWYETGFLNFNFKGVLLEVLQNSRLIHTTSGIDCFTIRVQLLYYKTVIILPKKGLRGTFNRWLQTISSFERAVPYSVYKYVLLNVYFIPNSLTMQL